ncbi:multiple inositol polyphosphate phosphatase 1 [Venturia canescens]|uniref:multiple inositol polyphosphate phosphatase 1 n=1 Tax=Venturia canescens TaxID=32260 RepID=UPI001C9C3435|nr:multiple inositol polyphosphate phosphatase 1 [Venturia canescens]XP_043280385.1 multiple inositol polyphosphate phosphatase 1 [Venturia canescens]XP_043280387.1 multiple inositol polyphosphate phosphatase 1 [Venturia canescens]XP_043280388.1 multiple inositol polyphosphate phosphatase 1 [Venturia canescens]XP_043280389.1 multiple inositol polyphosphate phosphatase 1 [Venturia canescens]XP_043280390.1 multiple inositol polyphosphate phosphatase 1 [Venturia canescens]XP_043280391.1 multiple
MRVIGLFLTLLLVCKAASRQVDFCYAEDEDPYLYLASKTSYHFVHGGKTRFQTVPECQPVQIWMASRHGARYPKVESVNKLSDLPKLREQIVYNHEHRGNGHLCNQDLDNLKLWNPNPNLTPDMALKLTPEGAEDSMLFGRRLQSNFPEILQPNIADITADNYKFRSTNSERTRASMESFMEGLFGSKNAVYPVDVPNGNDNFLKAYRNCSKWQEDDPSVSEERDKFAAMTDVAQNISRRLGFQYTLAIPTVNLMYDMCRFEKAWEVSKLSAWCAPFSKEELNVMEYMEDLYYYYAIGNGRKMNAQLGCPILQDMYNNFKQLERGNLTGKPRGVFYFTHTFTLLSLFTAMGIANDPEPLLASNYRQMTKRQFRTSFIAPFNANLVAVFYRCKNPDAPNKVMFYLQEKPLMFEGCQVGLCDWEYLKNKFSNVFSECDPNFCSNENGSASNRAWSTISVLIPFVIFLMRKVNEFPARLE